MINQVSCIDMGKVGETVANYLYMADLASKEEFFIRNQFISL